MLRRVVFVGLVAVGLLIAGGSFGYMAGLGAEGDKVGIGWAPLLGVALLFKAMLVLFLVLILSKLFFFRGRGCWHGGHGHHGHHRHHCESGRGRHAR